MKLSMYWDGMLTTDNVEAVGKLFNELLSHGPESSPDKFHTVIAALPVAYDKEDAGLSMYVHTSQKLYDKGVTAEVKDGRAYLTIHNSYGLWMLDSLLSGERAPYDSTYKNPYLRFKGNQVTIWHRAPAGNLLVWTFAAEDHGE